MKRKLTAIVVALFTVILLVSSCSKIDTTALGGDLIPEIDNINTFETFLDIITDNKLFDDTTRMLYSSAHALGIIENDAEFGKTTAQMYASFAPALYRTYPFTRRDSVIIDSVVLSLAYTTVFGDSNSVQHIEVREILPTTGFTDSLYPLNAPEFPTEPMVLGSSDVNYVSLKDSVFYRNGLDTVRSAGEMRIKLDTAWARRFVGYDTVAGQPYHNDTLFRQVFKGLEIKATEASPVKKALAYFNLSDNTKSRITFYIRKPKTTSGLDTTTAVFTYTRGPQANLVRRTPANNYLANVNNSTENDELLYIQSSPGSYALLKIDGLDTIANSLKVIHKAELICERAPSMEDFFAPPARMFIDAVNLANDSSFTIRNDYVPTQSSPGYELEALGGNFSKNKYSFTLTRYVQSLVTHKFPNQLLRIHAPFNTQPYYYFPNSMVTSKDSRQYLIVSEPVGFGRVILYGGGATDPAKKMKLRIIYSKI